MKKLAFIATAILALSASSAFSAGNAFDDGSPENFYIFGTHLAPVKLDNVPNPNDFYRSAGSPKNDFYNGRRLNSPLVMSHPLIDNPDNFGDGSPENQL